MAREARRNDNEVSCIVCYRSAPIQSDLLAPNLCHDAKLLSPSLPQFVVFYSFSEGFFFLIEALLFPERNRLSPLRPRVQPIINLRDSPSEHSLTF